MKFIRANLIPGEVVLHFGSLHWFIFVPGAVLTIVGTAMSFGGDEFSMSAFIGSIVSTVGTTKLIQAGIAKYSTELAVTTKRVIVKKGLIRRETVELIHSKVESFRVEQSLLGRLFGYGSVRVQGSGRGVTPVLGIANPLEFRRRALEAADRAAG